MSTPTEWDAFEDGLTDFPVIIDDNPLHGLPGYVDEWRNDVRRNGINNT